MKTDLIGLIQKKGIFAMFSSGLYEESFEKDACGIGMVVDSKGGSSNDIVKKGLTLLKNMAHRGAQGADPLTSDGAGILTQIPFELLQIQPGTAVGVLFVPQFMDLAVLQKGLQELALEFHLEIIGWRLVPVDAKILGPQARQTEPLVYHIFMQPKIAMEPAAFKKKLFLFQKLSQKKFRSYSGTRDPKTGQVLSQFTVVSLSLETIIYKGLMLPELLSDYFLDLQNPHFKSGFTLVHSRFSTNTMPAWELAHPFRYLCHNGEINTLRGNLNWMRSRHFADDIDLIQEGVSDSFSLDQALELLLISGHSLPKAMMMLIPEAWEKNSLLKPEIQNFYHFQSTCMEPWDGPAAVAFTDGKYVGATLDRNGLRPCRYQLFADGVLILASEVGALHLSEQELNNNPMILSDRLGPGKMLVVDLEQKKILFDSDIKSMVATEHDYGQWIQSGLSDLENSVLEFNVNTIEPMTFSFYRDLFLHSYTQEEIRMVLQPMLQNGEEATSSMGSDTPLAILDSVPQLLFKYFRQLFAQVTNPPIDPIREKSVMSLTTYLGGKNDPFLEVHEFHPDHQILTLSSPILNVNQWAVIKNWKPESSQIISSLVYSCLQAKDFQNHLDAQIQRAVVLVKTGTKFLILSDQAAINAVNSDMDQMIYSVPILLLISGIHQALVKEKIRNQVSIIVNSAEVRDVHHIACCIGYGAEAVYPRGVLELICQNSVEQNNYVKALEKGLLKVMSKMGISSVASYCGAQIFEALGVSSSLVNKYFTGTPSRIEGVDLKILALETFMRQNSGTQFYWNHNNNNMDNPGLDPESIFTFLPLGSEIHSRQIHLSKDSSSDQRLENHLWTPQVIRDLQDSTQNKNDLSFKKFSQSVDQLSENTLRGCFDIQTSPHKIPLSQVQPASEIVKSFTTGAMSFGALSIEAHETLAIAMNRMQAKSNSGEGGEAAERFAKPSNGDWKNSAIKQVASGRFGVTAEYLYHAVEIQIKMAQGAKPGEGGQLPGYKVDSVIAKTRYSTPGVTLISPPPHHDIYSIEDLAQLIYDLKNINPVAKISVKLVSCPGVGTVAAGVAKAHADKILISGDNGGTGASPLSSIKSAGSPWELGLAEAHQTLVQQGLRQRVVLETDGQLRNGKDVIIAALLGAQEFGFSTAPLIVEGCIMMRKCHLNTCPTGVATQDPVLRKKFKGQPEHVVQYFFFVAEEVRQYLSEMGYRSLDEITGRSDLLSKKKQILDSSELLKQKFDSIDLSKITFKASTNLKQSVDAVSNSILCKSFSTKTFSTKEINHITNEDRSIGALLSYQQINNSMTTNDKSLLEKNQNYRFQGSAGQSFGVFLNKNIELRLTGEANDYVGKGLSGGRVIITPSSIKRMSDRNVSTENDLPLVIAGNTCLYGATSGELFIAGSAGERFAVRNSGALAVVEGIGDHGCEYMTGGHVVILGRTGKNFAAGMSGGIAFVLDEFDEFNQFCNQELVQVSSVQSEKDFDFLFQIIHQHYLFTGSLKAEKILQSWAVWKMQFKKIISFEYLKIINSAISVAEPHSLIKSENFKNQ